MLRPLSYGEKLSWVEGSPAYIHSFIHSFIQAASPTYPVVLLVKIGTFRFEDKNNYEYEI